MTKLNMFQAPWPPTAPPAAPNLKVLLGIVGLDIVWSRCRPRLLARHLMHMHNEFL